MIGNKIHYIVFPELLFNVAMLRLDACIKLIYCNVCNLQMSLI